MGIHITRTCFPDVLKLSCYEDHVYCPSVFPEITLTFWFVCLYVLRLNVQVNNFSVMSGQSQCFLGLTRCLFVGWLVWFSTPPRSLGRSPPRLVKAKQNLLLPRNPHFLYSRKERIGKTCYLCEPPCPYIYMRIPYIFM